MSRTKHVSFEELAGNLAELLTHVRAEHTSLVVEYPNGEMVLIKPYAPTRQGTRKGAASDPDDYLQHVPNRAVDTKNISTMGAVYDLDPDSLTPG